MKQLEETGVQVFHMMRLKCRERGSTHLQNDTICQRNIIIRLASHILKAVPRPRMGRGTDRQVRATQ